MGDSTRDPDRERPDPEALRRCARGARLHAIAVSLALAAGAAPAEEPSTTRVAEQTGPAHPHLLGVQATWVLQGAPSFRSPYSGPNSLRGGEVGLSQTYTLYLGIRVLDGLDAYLEPEAATGTAPGQGLGLAGSGNGDLLGERGKLDVYVARAFLRWRTALGPEREPPVKLGRARYLVEETVPARRLVVTVGQLAVTDLLDQNAYANNPRAQFLNVAFVNDLAYDLPQDAHGYTRGVFVDYVTPAFAARAASFLLPEGPGGPLSWDLANERADALELTWSPRFLRRAAGPCVLRLLGWRNQGQMGRYDDALRAAAGGVPELAGVRRSGTVRSGAGLNAEVPLADDGGTGLFGRAGVSSGDVEPISFAEADAAVSIGAQVSGRRWGRGDDAVGLAAGVAFASAPHRSYLAAGGLGSRLGDGALAYGPEIDTEAYYALQLAKALALSADVQVIVNPGFNRDRGPVVLAALRAHLEL